MTAAPSSSAMSGWPPPPNWRRRDRRRPLRGRSPAAPRHRTLARPALRLADRRDRPRRAATLSTMRSPNAPRASRSPTSPAPASSTVSSSASRPTCSFPGPNRSCWSTPRSITCARAHAVGAGARCGRGFGRDRHRPGQTPTGRGTGLHRHLARRPDRRPRQRPAPAPTPRATFVQGDLLTPLSGPFHCVVANLPYIPQERLGELEPEVAEHEPRIALTPGTRGTELTLRLITPTPLAPARQRHRRARNRPRSEVAIAEPPATAAQRRDSHPQRHLRTTRAVRIIAA